MLRLDGRRIVITGSSRGLGRAFAEASAARGASVVINGTNTGALGEVEASIRGDGGSVVAVAGSVADDAVCRNLVDTCVAEFGGIDVMINNAGIVRDRTLMKMTVDDFDAVLAVNLRGAFSCTRYAALAMRESGGQIVQVISASGLSGGFGQGNYAAAKAGMMGLLRTAVLEFSRHQIRCNAFWPIAETDMTQVVFERARQSAGGDGAAPEPRDMGFGKPREVAEGMVWLCSDAAAGLNGQCVTFNGRKTALWTHPSEMHVSFRDQPFSAEDLEAHYRGIEPLPIHRPRMVDAG